MYIITSGPSSNNAVVCVGLHRSVSSTFYQQSVLVSQPRSWDMDNIWGVLVKQSSRAW